MEIKTLLNHSHQMRERIKALSTELEGLQLELRRIDDELNTRLDLKGREVDELSEDEFQLLMSEINDEKSINAEVAYITPEQQIIREIQLSRGSTIQDALDVCGIVDEMPEIDLTLNKVGVFGTIKPLTETLYDGDRVEIYRPLSDTSS